MRFHEIVPLSREEAESAFASGAADKICDALVRTAYHDSDWRWVQQQCLYFSRHSDPKVRGLSATCFGHLARIHRQLDLDIVLPVLEQLRKDPAVSAQAEDAMEDIKVFLKND